MKLKKSLLKWSTFSRNGRLRIFIASTTQKREEIAVNFGEFKPQELRWAEQSRTELSSELSWVEEGMTRDKALNN